MAALHRMTLRNLRRCRAKGSQITLFRVATFPDIRVGALAQASMRDSQECRSKYIACASRLANKQQLRGLILPIARSHCLLCSVTLPEVTIRQPRDEVHYMCYKVHNRQFVVLQV